METKTRPNSAAEFAAYLHNLFSQELGVPNSGSVLPAVAPARALCETSEGVPLERNSLFIGVSDLPTRVGVIEGTHSEEILVGKGAVLPVSGGAWISYSGPVGADLLRIEIRDDMLLLNLRSVADLDDPSPALALLPTPDTQEEFRALAKAMNEAIAANGGAFPNSTTDAVLQVCRLVFSILAAVSHIDIEIQPNGLGFTETASQYVRSNLRRLIRRPDIAAYCGISESYLTLLVRKNLGMNLTDMMTVTRVTRAYEYIAGSTLKIASIANACGFSSNNYFIRAYRNLNGMTPLQVRKRVQKSEALSIADQYSLFKLKGFKLVEPLKNGHATNHMTSPADPRFPFAVANITNSPVVIYQRSRDGKPIDVCATWIPAGRSRIIWSRPGLLWQAESHDHSQSMGVFQTLETPQQTLLLS